MRVHALSIAVIVAVSACAAADVEPDAGPTPEDAAPAPDGPSRGPVTVTVVGDNDTSFPGQPWVGVPVVFISRDGTTATVETDAAGRATHEIVDAASVTVVRIRPSGSYSRLTTIMDVAPNEHVAIGVPEPDRIPTSRHITISTPPYSGASDYRLFVACGTVEETDDKTRWQVALEPGCDLRHRTVAATAVLSKRIIQNVAVIDDLGAGNSVTLPATWQSPAPTFSARVHGLPTEVTWAGMQVEHLDRDLLLYEARLGARPADGVVEVTSQGLSAGTRTKTTTLLQRPDGGDQFVIDQSDGLELRYEVDGHDALLPWPSRPSYDPASRTVSWTQESGDVPDVVAITITTGTSSSLQAQSDVTWTVYAPPGSRSEVTFPRIPAELDELAARPVSAVEISTTEVSSIDGYAGIRTSIDRYDGPYSSGPAPWSGRIRGTRSYVWLRSPASAPHSPRVAPARSSYRVSGATDGTEWLSAPR